MCGIWAVFGCGSDFFKYCSRSFQNIRGRGPEAWRLEYQDQLKDTCIGFHRLAIVDGKYGMQPLRLHQFPHCALICNGEIYNCKKIRDENNFEYETECDVECVLHLIKSKGISKAVRHLDGVFAFCLIDSVAKRVYFGRDPYGVRPMFKLVEIVGGWERTTVAVASEAKALIDIAHDLNLGDGDGCFSIRPFQAGCYEEFEIIEESGRLRSLRRERYFEPLRRPLFQSNIDYESLENCTDIYANIRRLFTEACRKRLMADRRIGCLLSGGLDSSLVAAVLAQLVKHEQLPYRLQTFAIGMDDSPDLQAARTVASHIDSEHHEIRFTEKDIFPLLDELIYSLESFDITTVRASIGMLLIAKYIRERTDTIVLFSGEGADELAQGYIYFKDAPDAGAAHLESLRLLNDIYLFDGLRADRTTASQGLELRVPFLDIQFTNYYLNLDEQLRRPHTNIEKWLIRKSFAESGLLPDEILWRPKEAFSDGVTSVKKSLFSILNDLINERISNKEFKEKSQRYVHCRPLTKEALYYRQIFDEHYPNCAEHFIPYFWMPKWTNVTDPSARFIKHYKHENHKNGSL